MSRVPSARTPNEPKTRRKRCHAHAPDNSETTSKEFNPLKIPHTLRRYRYYACIAPVIRELRAQAVNDIPTFTKRLNRMGVTTPEGQPFTARTCARIVLCLKELGLDSGPRDTSTKGPSNRGFYTNRIPEWLWTEIEHIARALS
jgi:hypothetical protein